MSEPWLHVVGIGEEGLDGLTPATRAVVEAAEVILGGDRHHALSESITAERIAWPSPFDAMIDTIRGMKGRRAVVLVTGDPLWFSVGARIGRAIDPSEIVYHPQLSAFQLAAARMGWSLADVETLTVHGRPVEQMIAFIQPLQRLLVLTTGSDTPGKIARFLTDRGFGKSRLTVLAAMGGADEARFDGLAESWDHEVPAFNTLAVDCVAAPDAALIPRVPGLDDALFQSDGTMTKQEVRAATLAKLRHPNLVRLLHYIEEHNTSYVVTEFEAGQTLGELVIAFEGLPATRVPLVAEEAVGRGGFGPRMRTAAMVLLGKVMAGAAEDAPATDGA